MATRFTVKALVVATALTLLAVVIVRADSGISALMAERLEAHYRANCIDCRHGYRYRYPLSDYRYHIYPFSLNGDSVIFRLRDRESESLTGSGHIWLFPVGNDWILWEGP